MKIPRAQKSVASGSRPSLAELYAMGLGEGWGLRKQLKVSFHRFKRADAANGFRASRR